jgi:hypothetical protein
LGWEWSWGKFLGGSRSRAFDTDSDLNARLFVVKLGPTRRLLRKNLESGNRGGMEKGIDLVFRQCDVDILSHAAEVAVMPNRPTSGHDRFAFQNFE